MVNFTVFEQKCEIIKIFKQSTIKNNKIIQK
jgi:hypothetical protein